jgi:hypothetical protein
MYGIPEKSSPIAKMIIFIFLSTPFIIGIGYCILLCREDATPAKKQSYTIESIPCYDSVGNVYIHRQTYDHLPTQKDSTDFEKEGLRIKKD